MQKKTYTLTDLQEIMTRLRDPKTGCPWDVEQDYNSITKHTIEEAYEVVDAVHNKDFEGLRDELGDLLLQILFYTEFAQEDKHFNFDDVVHALATKLIDQHPHVFADKSAATAQEAEALWDAKKAEKNPDSQNSIFDTITIGLPALLRAQKIQKKAAKTGFEWENEQHILNKIDEELLELKEAHQSHDSEKTKEELGDLLFVLANYAKNKGYDAEEVLRDANCKFINRYNGMESDIKKDNKDTKTLSSQEWVSYWIKQKT